MSIKIVKVIDVVEKSVKLHSGDYHVGFCSASAEWLASHNNIPPQESFFECGKEIMRLTDFTGGEKSETLVAISPEASRILTIPQVVEQEAKRHINNLNGELDFLKTYNKRLELEIESLEQERDCLIGDAKLFRALDFWGRLIYLFMGKGWFR